MPETALAVVNSSLVQRDLQEVEARARVRIREFIQEATAENTRAAYESDWAHFRQWCAMLGLVAMPAARDTVLAYVSELPSMPNANRHGRGSRKVEKLGYSVATITRRLATIARNHKRAGFENPCVSDELKEVLRGIRRKLGPAKAKKALRTDHLKAMLWRKPETLQEIRDRALLLYAYAAAARRSEVAQLDVEDVSIEKKSLTVQIRRSKTDQEGIGRAITIHAGRDLCPVEAMRQWIQAAGIESGAVFRSIGKGSAPRIGGRLTTEGISLIIKRYAKRLGLDPKEFGAHSTRRGHVTEHFERGGTPQEVAPMTGHKSLAMLFRYYEEVQAKKRNSSQNLGL